MPDCDDKNVFLAISSWLTGFSDVELLGTGLLETYWEVVQREASVENLQYFLAASRDVLAQGDGCETTTHQLILERLIPASCYDNLAQNIVYMWYAGAWYPTVSTATDLAQVRNISPNAYIQGLMWAAADTHPPGAKQPGFGSWAEPPVGV